MASCAALAACSVAHAGVSAPPDGASGTVNIDVTNMAGTPLPAKVELVPSNGSAASAVIRAPKGQIESPCPAGRYKAYMYVYEWGTPIMIGVQDIEIRPGKEAFLPVNLAEGSSGNKALREFDQDMDLVLDRVELDAGTDPADPASFPGCRPAPYTDKVLSEEAGWYRGDLHVRSAHGGGQETASELVKRAEKAGLDFLAITDRNTMEACGDPGFTSSKVVLIPAMEWGDEKSGVALIYGPKTIPEPADDVMDAQAIVYRVQGQGGVFAVAHPCFPNAPWQRGLGFVNAVEVWCRSWGDVPPITLEALTNKEWQTRNKEGKLVYSISLAAATPNLSANGQATLFWDYELRRGLRACPIAGSLSSSRDVPVGRPLTYVYAEKKSVEGILDGLRRGRTYISNGPDGPRILFQADVLADGMIDVSESGVIPVGVKVGFYINILGAKGRKAQLLEDGRPAVTKIIEKDNFLLRCIRKPNSRMSFRVRVVDSRSEKGAKNEAFDDLDVVAMTAPIYAQDMILMTPGMDPTDMWIKLKNDSLPPMYVDSDRRSPDGRPLVRTNKQAPPPTAGQFQPPAGSEVRTIEPQWRY